MGGEDRAVLKRSFQPEQLKVMTHFKGILIFILFI
jgi:hypothetical protein